jgi:N-acyl homoserine lactone hydrolase
MVTSRTILRRATVGATIAVIALGVLSAWATRGSVRWAPHRLFVPPKPAAKLRDWDDALVHGTRVRLCSLETGRVSVPRSSMLRRDHVRRDDSNENVPFPIYAHWIRHPSRGDLLVDSGLDESFARDSFGNFRAPARAVHTLLGASFELSPGDGVTSQLAAFGAHPAMVLLTHAHGDHTAGLPALGAATRVLLGLHEREDAAAYIGYGHLAAGQVLEEIDFDRGQPLAPFDSVVDLFGDGSVVAIATPGHSRGHTSYLVAARSGPVLLTGDASHSAWAFEHDVGPAAPTAGEEQTAQRSLDQIRAFAREHPAVRVVFGHEATTRICDAE